MPGTLKEQWLEQTEQGAEEEEKRSQRQWAAEGGS